MSKIIFVGVIKIRQEYILTNNTITIYYVYRLRERRYSWSNALPPSNHLSVLGHLLDPNVEEMNTVINLFIVTVTMAIKFKLAFLIHFIFF